MGLAGLPWFSLFASQAPCSAASPPAGQGEPPWGRSALRGPPFLSPLPQANHGSGFSAARWSENRNRSSHIASLPPGKHQPVNKTKPGAPRFSQGDVALFLCFPSLINESQNPTNKQKTQGGKQPVPGSISLWPSARSEVQDAAQKPCHQEGLFAKAASSCFTSVPTTRPRHL